MSRRKNAGSHSDSRALPDPQADAPLLEVEGLRVSFPSEDGTVRAVRGVDLAVGRGEVLALVGESGSGKSVTSTAVMGLLDESAQVSGSVRLHGTELLGRDDDYMSRIRGSQVAMVFQDPLSALTPVYTVGSQIVEALKIHDADMSNDAAWERAVELLDVVGIPNPDVRARAYPHEFSGGMRQRAVIAIAIANNPDLIIADEPTTALDVTIQAQILDVLRTAQKETGAGVIMITHDLGVVAGMADRVSVMYAGRIVETGDVDDLFHRSRMPYTIGLLASLPRLDARKDSALAALEGNPPSLLAEPTGCPFAPRCPIAQDECLDGEPALTAVRDADDALSDACGPPSAGVQLSACRRSGEIEEGDLDGTAIYPVPSLKTPDTMSLPREDRPEVLRATNLVKEFPLMKGAVFKRRVGTVHAVDGISFDVRQGETFALEGSSFWAGIPRGSPAPSDALFVATCRSSSRTRWPPSTRAFPSSTSSPSRCAPTDGRGAGSVVASRSSWSSSGSSRVTPTATRATSPADSVSASASPGRWPWSPSCSCSMSPSPLSTCPSRPGSSTCSTSCAGASGSAISSSPTTCRSSVTSRTASR